MSEDTSKVLWRGVDVNELTPPAVADDSKSAIVTAVAAVLRESSTKDFAFRTDIANVDAKFLPALVAENSLDEFLEPGMPEIVVRRLLDQAWELHTQKGYISGVRLALQTIGMSVEWVQWFEQEPMGQPNTHVVTAYANEHIFADEPVLLNERLQRAAVRMIDASKRWSQDVSFQLGTRCRSSLSVGAKARSHAQMRSRGVVRLPTVKNQFGVSIVNRSSQLAHSVGEIRLPRISSRIGVASSARAISFLQIYSELAA